MVAGTGVTAKSPGPDARDLIARIEHAFAGVRYPGDLDLTDSTYGEEPAALVDEFRGRTDWRALDAEFLDQAPAGWGTALSFFSARALQFYLPAYLIADLEGRIQRAEPAFRLTWSVTPAADRRKVAKIWGGGTMGEHGRRCFDAFDAAQARVVVDYLWWKLEAVGGYDPTIEQALEHYWLHRVEGV